MHFVFLFELGFGFSQNKGHIRDQRLINFDGPNAISSAGQALFEWLHTPSKDGQPKQFVCRNFGAGNIYEWLVSFKEPFLHATTYVSYKIQLELYDSAEIVAPFELMNGRTNEKLTLKKDGEYGNGNADWIMKRCPIWETAAVQWEDENLDNLNTVNFMLYGDCIGPLSPPKTGQKKAKKRKKNE